MDITFRPFLPDDKDRILLMMRSFYDSPALIFTPGDDVLERNFNACISPSPYVSGFSFVDGNKIVGYGILAFSFSTEVGGECVWIEDIFILESYRHQHIGSDFLKFVQKNYPARRYRLEAEEENKSACNVYADAGFEKLDYIQYIKEL